jgi:hypothetical protein
MKSFCFKLQDALIDFAYCPQYNAVRRAPALRALAAVLFPAAADSKPALRS